VLVLREERAKPSLPVAQGMVRSQIIPWSRRYRRTYSAGHLCLTLSYFEIVKLLFAFFVSDQRLDLQALERVRDALKRTVPIIVVRCIAVLIISLKR
jgi:hypothetical protein